MRRTLRAKGILTFVALVSYVVVVSAILGADRSTLLDIALHLESIWAAENEQARTQFAIHHLQQRVHSALDSGRTSVSLPDDLVLDLELVHSGIVALRPFAPALDAWAGGVERMSREIGTAFTHSALHELLRLSGTLEEGLADLGTNLHNRRRDLWVEYHRVYDRMTFVALSTMVFAALAFGAMVSLFFSRIAWDIGKLEKRALEIVAGFRGPPLPVTRNDEIGGLMDAVNNMQYEIRRHEAQLELTRQQRFHQEKMAAIGSLAAAVAHEINNPIAAIAGIAQSMASSGGVAAGQSADFEGDGPSLIIEQAQRISAITRQIAEFSRPHSPKPELTDLNRLVRSICTFTSYDRRLHQVEVGLDLDPAIPAVEIVNDRLTQVLMNLLLNAGDALGAIVRDKPSIRVATRLDGARFLLSVADNGEGMDEETLLRAFEEGFSTKPAGTGMGLGLFLCKALVEQDGGTIHIDSVTGEGTTVTVGLPVARNMNP